MHNHSIENHPVQIIQNSLRPAWLILASVAVLLAVALPRWLALDRYVTPDEALWLNRSGNFYYALGNGDWASTYQKEHPGVTVMWAGVGAFLQKYPNYYLGDQGQLRVGDFHRLLESVNKQKPVELLLAARQLMVVGHTLILLISFLYAVQLLGFGPALLGLLLIAFDAFHIGLTRLLHLDGLYSSLVLCSVLSLVSYLRSRQMPALIVSATAAGLAWLTKSPALFLLPIAALLAVGLQWPGLRVAVRERSLRKLWKTAWPLGLWAAWGGLVFVLLWPAMWVNPLGALTNIFSQAQAMAESGHGNAVFFNGQVYGGGVLGPTHFWFYPLAILWRASPFALVGLLLAALAALRRQAPFHTHTARQAAACLLVIVVVYLIGLTLAAKKFDRYALPLFAPLDLLAGLGWIWAASRLGGLVRVGWARVASAGILLTVLLAQLAIAAGTYPYYLTYYNPLLGGSGRAVDVMQIGWGEGIDEAARYLNEKPDAKKLVVSSWYSVGSFSYFFTGQDRPIPYTTNVTQQEWLKFTSSDYAVIYIHQWQRQIPKPILDYVSALQPVHTVWLDGLEYVRVYQLP